MKVEQRPGVNALLSHVLMAFLKWPPSIWAHNEVNSRFSWSGTDNGGLGRDFCLDRPLRLLEAGVAFGPIVVVVGEVINRKSRNVLTTATSLRPHGRRHKNETNRLRWWCRRRCRRGCTHGCFLNVWYRTFRTRYSPGLTRDLRRGHHRSPAAHRTNEPFTTNEYARLLATLSRKLYSTCHLSGAKHRGFAFVTFGSPEDAQDAIDNMDLNELQGKVLKVNLARHTKAPIQGLGNRAGSSEFV